MHLHFVGIGGVFMSGLALLAKTLGYRVTGCDGPLYPPTSEILAAHGIEPMVGFDADPAKIGADRYVIGNAISRGNPLLEEILDQGVPFVSGPQWLAEEVLAGRWVVAIAGTHGKTTTTAMVVHILREMGLDPGFLIGGAPIGFEAPAAVGSSPFFVVEADEYDSAFCDKRAKFVHYRPRTLVINHLEFDHADIYADLAAIETQFHHLLRIMPRSGRVIVREGVAAIDRVLARGVWAEVERFGWLELGKEGGAEWRLVEEGETVGVVYRGERVGRVQLPVAGAHNALNAVAAVAAVAHLGVDPGAAAAQLATFRGVRRRLELVGTVRGIRVFDDFAHHPTAIAATLAALRPQVSGRLWALIEPRSNTMRRGVWQGALAEALAAADRVVGLAEGLTWDLAAALAPLGRRARVVKSAEEVIAAVVPEVAAGDAVVAMSNGAFAGIPRRLCAALAEKGE
ncbi:MAG: UDP-N-acetylmuramate:L-alanyl-gamma-D-glutamyl-meso-diaminopimelate ligase [Hydrogenophilus sp.]|nr:UDP-N-acetylmuramate:L-alanyl-gamma-D-glutamyl-meso-diaminopimelate ligase [Hydrogenophilus sp.]